MQKVVARLQSISADFIKAQSTEILNEHLSQLDDVISQVNSQVVIPELKLMQNNKQKLSDKSKAINEIVDASDDEDEDEANAEEEEEKSKDEILDRVLGPSLLTQLDEIQVPRTIPFASNAKFMSNDKVEDKKQGNK